MNTLDQDLMQKYDIKCTEEKVYHYREYRYSKLSDAINYAKLQYGSKVEHEPKTAIDDSEDERKS